MTSKSLIYFSIFLFQSDVERVKNFEIAVEKNQESFGFDLLYFIKKNESKEHLIFKSF
jgi:hypothetical protein